MVDEGEAPKKSSNRLCRANNWSTMLFSMISFTAVYYTTISIFQHIQRRIQGSGWGGCNPPLNSFFLLLLFCLILPKNNRIKLFLRSYFTFTIRLLVKLWKDNVHFAKVVSGSGILKQATWTGDIHWKVNEGDWDRPNAWVSLKWVQRLTENEENNRLLCKEIR